MGHEDFLMLAAITSSMILQFSDLIPGLPSWLPAVAAGLYKYSVDISRERKNRKTGKMVVKVEEVEVLAKRLRVLKSKENVSP